jgi:[ribosomal protein S5]-alanine N-acetyltransferase
MPGRIQLRRPLPTDQREFLAAVRRSREIHRSWVRAPASPRQYRDFLRRHDEKTHWNFLVCRRDNGALVGVINLSNAVRGSFHSAYLSYYVFAGHQRQGLMREGLLATIRHAFRTLKLHRLEANVQPANIASIALVQSCGLRKEGFSPRYLKIAGKWRDHERWAIVAR